MTNAKLESENARLRAGLERIGMLSASYKPVVERLLNGETIEQIAALPADLPIEIMQPSAQLTRELLTSVAFEHRDSSKFEVALGELQAFLRRPSTVPADPPHPQVPGFRNDEIELLLYPDRGLGAPLAARICCGCQTTYTGSSCPKCGLLAPTT